MATMVSSPEDVLHVLRDAFELVEDRPGVAYIQFPVRWRSGDWLPVAIRRVGSGWQLTDDALHYAELGSRTRARFYTGQIGKDFESALARHSLRLEDGAIVRDVPAGDDWAAAYADFIRGLFAVEDVIDRIRPRKGRKAGHA